ncbi:hypothetical protein ACFVJS_08335, partial [Nocardioides sp. NPDC057772]
MLQLTENATTIVRSISEQSQGAGLRLASNAEPDGALSAALVPEAEAQDQVIEQEGARIMPMREGQNSAQKSAPQPSFDGWSKSGPKPPALSVIH